MTTLNTVSDPTILATPGTPQNLAAEWVISEKDNIRCPDDVKLIQRYVMAVFYYSTEGDDWSQCNQFDTGCGFNFPFIGRERYLSPAHECEWAGSTCDGDQCLIQIEFELNNLAGLVPYELEQLTFLKNLVLEQGSTAGTIPSELGSLTNLEVLDLDINLITGTIPEEIYDIEALEILDLNGNQLTGAISPKIGNLTNLIFLQLNDNFLTGTIPSTMGNLVNLRVAELYRNNLTGEIPTEVCDIRIPPFGDGFLLQTLTTDCTPNAVTSEPEVFCPCCSACYPVPE